MTCADFKALAQAYALGALDPDEREAAEAHLAEPRIHDGCLDALAAAEAAAGLLAFELPGVQPAELVWDRIEARLAQEARLEDGGSPSKWRTFIGGLALAASVAAIALWLGHTAGQETQRTLDAQALSETKADAARAQMLTEAGQTKLNGDFERCRQNLQAAQAQVEAQSKGMSLLGRPATQLVALAPSKGLSSSGTVIFNRKAGEAVVVASALAPAAGHDYELWVIRGREKLPAGLLKIEPTGPTVALVNAKLLTDGVDVFAITLEPAGGSLTPRGTLVLAGAVKKG